MLKNQKSLPLPSQILILLLIITLFFTIGSPPLPQAIAAGVSDNLSNIKIEAPVKGNPKLDSRLNKLVPTQVARRAIPQQLNSESDNTVIRVIVESAPGKAADIVKSAGSLGNVEAVHDTLVQIAIPVSQLTTLAELDGVRFVREPMKPWPDIISEGVSLINADDWQTASYNGAGVKIGILDGGFSGYTTRQSEGELPASITTWWATSLGGPGSSIHGTACAEIVYDIAPGAQYFFANFGTEVEYGDAVNWLISQGVHVISCSVGWPVSGPGNGTGLICASIDAARAAGILWAQSVGNSAERHWQGTFYDPGGNGLNDFGFSDDYCDIEADSGDTITIMLKWNDAWGASANDYDLYVLNNDITTTTIVAYSTATQDGQDDNDYPREGLSFTAAYSGVYRIVINKYENPAPVNFHLYSYYHELQYQSAAGSLTVPADSPNAVTVGAVPYSAPTTIEEFSSRGPTDDGRVKPDLVAPDGVSTATYGANDFYGTSASAPHVAGAAALVKQQNTAYTPAQIQTYLETNAVDLGSGGKDNIYGYGRLNLGAATRNLTMAVNGSGTVTPAVGTHTYPVGATANITATPAAGWQFTNWTGGVTDNTSASTTVVMTTDKTITANFSQPVLTMAVNGSGTTTPAAGTHSYDLGVTVNITSTPATGWQFINWTGDVTDNVSANTTVTMNSNKTITANFSRMPGLNILTMAVNGNGTVTPAVGTHTYPLGATANVTATPDANWQFVNWSGGVADNTSAITTVLMDADKTITANFSQIVKTLTMAVNGSGTVTPSAGTSTYPVGATVNVTATTTVGWQFINWTGEVSDVSSATTTVLMNVDKTVTANFGQIWPADKIAFASWRDGAYPEIYIMNSDGTNQTRLTNNGANDFNPDLSNDCSRIVFRSDRVSSGYLFSMNMFGTDVRQIPNTQGGESPKWSPDGTKIAFSSNRNGMSNIYIVNSDGSNLTQVTTNSGYRVAWSPDGARIAFSSVRNGSDNIYLINIDGTGEARITNEPSGSVYSLDWSPDGSKIAYTWADPGYDVHGINIINADGSGKVTLSNGVLINASSVSWSPDGTKLTFSTTRHAPIEIYTVNVNGSGLIQLTVNNVDDGEPSWSAEEATFILSMAVSGGGAVNPIAGTHTYDLGATVNVTATPLAGWRFNNWTGDVTDNLSANTTVTMDSDKTVTANFSRVAGLNILTMAVNGSGIVTPTTGTHAYLVGATVNITATAAAGWQFVNWTGSVASSNSASTNVTLDVDRAVTANFSQIPAPPSGGGGGGGGGGAGGITGLMGIIGETGTFGDNVLAETADHKAQVYIPQGTVGKNRQGSLLSSIIIKETSDPPNPPADHRGIGQVYDVGPDGATFNPPIAFTLTYSDGDIPNGVSETNIFISNWDPVKKEWIKLECTVDPEKNTASTKLSHFSTYSLIVNAQAARFSVADLTIPSDEINIGDEITISAIVTNTGGLTGDYEVVLNVDGIVMGTNKVSLGGEGNAAIGFNYIVEHSGTHSIDINGLHGEFTVLPGLAVFEVKITSISSQEILLGEAVEIKISVTNQSESGGTCNVTLKVNQSIIETLDVTVPSNDLKTVAFTFKPMVSGTLTLDVNGSQKTLVVKEIQPPPKDKQIEPIPLPADEKKSEPAPELTSNPDVSQTTAPIPDTGNRLPYGWIAGGLLAVITAGGLILWRRRER